VAAPVAAPSAPPAPAAEGGAAAVALRDHIMRVLRQATVPLDFEAVFKKLEESGAPLPGEKPKLLLRRLLYDKNVFNVVGGKFTIK
jgi:hypothetical protein